jgi:hypothetical protein
MKKEHFFQYNSAHYKELFRSIKREELSDDLILLAGVNAQFRKQCIDEISREFIGEPIIQPLEEIIVKSEDESFDRTNAFFDTLPENPGLLIFTNGEQLNGVYTGFTFSVVKYASPQEKHFLKRLKEVECLKVIDFEDTYSLDETIVRHAKAVITFNPPTSAIERFFWHLSQFRVNGSRLPTKRPA